MRLFLILLIGVSLTGCGGQEPNPGCAAQDEQSAIYEGPLKIEYATHFDLERTQKGIDLHILDPDTGEREETFHLDPTKKYSLISLSSTLNGMLSILGSGDHLRGISDIQYVYDPDIRKRYAQGKILDYGDESAQSLEKLAASGANTILYSGFGDEFPNSKQLEQLGFSIIPIYDWRETHPLGKAEWIKLVGILTGKTAEAVAYFDEVEKAYNATRALVAKTNTRPTVISGNLLNDIWYAPAGDSYMALLIRDAGARYTHANEKGTGSNEFSIEQILQSDRETEFWINPGMPTRQQVDKLNPHARHLKSYHNMYCYSPNVNKFWERSAAEPHLLLADLIHIFHPEIKEIKSLHFYEKIQ